MKLKEYIENHLEHCILGIYEDSEFEENRIGFCSKDLRLWSISTVHRYVLDKTYLLLNEKYLDYDVVSTGMGSYTYYKKQVPIVIITKPILKGNENDIDLKDQIKILKDKIAELEKQLTKNTIPPKTLLDTDCSSGTLYLAQIDNIGTVNDCNLKEYDKYFPISVFDHHLVYPDLKYAERLNTMFNIVADIMWFKWNFDRDYIPKNGESTYVLLYSITANKWDYFRCDWNSTKYKEHLDFYFSTEKLVKKCAEYLNNKYKED